MNRRERLVSMSFRQTGGEAEKAAPLAAEFVGSQLSEYIELEENHVGDLSFYSAGGWLGH